jgi:hypothetical protein
MRELKSEAAANHANLAARAAVLASTSALDACPEAPTDDARLMRIDLTGMAGWLRAHGVDVAFPRNARQATHEVGDRLRARNHGALADQLTKDVEATLAIPVGANGDVASANRLLQRVDDAEKAVR